MSEEFEASFISLTDDEGNEFELEYLDTIEYNGNVYMVFFPTMDEDADEDDEDYGLIILRCVPGDPDDMLESVDDDEELNAVYDLYMETLYEEEEDEDGSE